ncbi:XLF-domain-containing protein [Mollisia scopiformis]|uniref:Non-homologous end-joining factor 1 n=1 Tax=Mollisia scopiformis TaxID=149040 RepID=A0A194XWU6_MOLSC|nr:XLF-domain-containing protein [Mollisia scopiformis]KUJ24519.1 XLF-domain-containing protein [Mollisia scopiformis]
MMAWKPLRVSASAGAHLPPLLISTNFTNDSYTIYLSDLTSIWSESLERAAIIRRSREESTSIDPSDAAQFKIFRDKIKLGLEGGKDTTLALSILADPSRPSLVLNVTVNLPGGLPPLDWPIRLAAGPQCMLTGQLIKPLLQAQHERIQEANSLVDILKDKDHVIQKLLDKLESQGTELSQVFPQAAGKVGRKVDRKKAAERVKGLAQFDVGSWKEGLDYAQSPDTTQLIANIFGASADALPLRGGDEISEEDTEEWWDNIKGITVNLVTGKISTRGPSKASRRTTPLSKIPPPLPKQESTNDDDAFQTQATPPRSSNAKVSAPKAKVETSSDDDDLDAPSQRSTKRSKIPDSFPKSPSPHLKAPSLKVVKKFGNLGGEKAAPAPSPPTKEDESTDDEEPIPLPKSTKKASPQVIVPDDEVTENDDEHTSPPPKAAPQARSPSPEPVPKPQKKFGKIGGKKDTPPPPTPELEPDDEPEPSPPPKAATPPATKAKKPKFGQIGGKKKTSESTPVPEESVATSPAPKAGIKRKLGAIGHKAVKAEPSSQNPEEDIRGRAPTKEETPPPRETSEDRADRKREQLKRELEEKAKAPVKKKRKF